MGSTETDASKSAIENYKRALTLSIDSPIEKIRDIYSVWAKTYDQVTSVHSNFPKTSFKKANR